MIVVEGPDGAGKSTLVQKMIEAFGLEEFPTSEGDRDNMYKHTISRGYIGLEEMVSPSGNKTLVFDRWYFSELVYGPLWRDGYCAFTPTQQKHFDQVIRAVQPPIIFCLPELSTVKKNVEASHQLDKVSETIEKIYWKYYRLWQRYSHAALYNYEHHNSDKLFRHYIMPYLQHKEAISWR